LENEIRYLRIRIFTACFDKALSDAYFAGVDTRAAEVFIELVVLDPLRSLSNVDEAYIYVLRTDGSFDIQELEPQYEDILFDVGFDITYENDVASDTEDSEVDGENESDDEEDDEEH